MVFMRKNFSSIATYLAIFMILIFIGLSLDNYNQKKSSKFFLLEEESLVTPYYFNCPIAHEDLNNDEIKDWVLGECNSDDGTKNPIKIYFATSSGGYRDAGAGIPKEAKMIYPIKGAVNDFSGDGLKDIIIYDQGDASRGQAPTGGFYGDNPIYLKSDGYEKWVIDDSLNKVYIKSKGTDKVHAKNLAQGDIDKNGFPDLWIESGGGYTGENYYGPSPHFILNYGDGNLR